VKDLLSYLRVVANPKSDVDVVRIINVPSRKIGESTLEKLVQVADERGVSLFEALGPVAEALGPQARNAVLRFRDLLHTLIRAAGDLRPADLAEQVLEQSGYLAMLRNDDSAEAETRLQNLRELVGSIMAYEEEAAAAGEESTLSTYLERVTLASDVDALEDAPRVAMMTVHAAKGLEFDTVFLTGMEEDLFPFRGMDPKRNDDQEEERRLAYVAVTRARRRLWITHASRRAIFGQTRYGIASRFLGDLPRGSVRQEMTASMRTLHGTRSGPGPSAPAFGAARSRGDAWAHPQERAAASMRGASRPAAPAHAPGERYVERDEAHDGGGEGSFHVGARVQHRSFGMGVIQAVGAGADPIVTVKFSGYSPKSIKASFLKPAG
jgi:DNA helicase-2/ATP-dependent DNA helicase PcrA